MKEVIQSLALRCGRAEQTIWTAIWIDTDNRLYEPYKKRIVYVLQGVQEAQEQSKGNQHVML